MRTMRAIITVALGALLWTTPAGAQEPACTDFIEAQRIIAAEGSRSAVYEGRDSEAIERGITRAMAQMAPAERTFLALWLPNGKVRIGGFINGCLEDFADITPETLALWLEGQGASQ
jgi:hypothetical protein